MGLFERREYSFSRAFEPLAAIIMITLTPKIEAGVSGRPAEMQIASIRANVSY